MRNLFSFPVTLFTVLVFIMPSFAADTDENKQKLPNVIIIFADDLGYGDLAAYGHPTIKTPHLDQLAFEGQKWTNFYASSSVCTPSRTGLLTGRLPIRSGMCSSKRRVLFPDSGGGLPQEETTIAKSLKQKNYATACIGKWHLGHLEGFQPLDHGFDYYYGIPYSNDMDRKSGLNGFEASYNPEVGFFNVPLMRNREIIERPADQTTITNRYTSEVINFIRKNKNKPFFIYQAHSMPHVPLFASKEFAGKSIRGIYGDVIEEIDWSVGQIIETLKKEGLDKNTLVVFTSDNGPWLSYRDKGGSAGLLREGKGSTYEGGMRVPAIFWWPGKIKPNVVHEIGSTLDLFPTVNSIAGVNVPPNRPYDGYDISKTLFNGDKTERENIVFYWGEEIFAIRHGEWKAHFKTWDNGYFPDQKTVAHDPPLLYNLSVDPSEKYNISKDHPEIIVKLKGIVEAHKKTVAPIENQLEKRISANK